MALVVIAYTTADVRYRFRVAIAPGNLLGITFGVCLTVGVATLLTDLWVAQQWWVLRVEFLNTSLWQAVLATLLLGTFMWWMSVAFVWPPKFGRRNSLRFAQVLARYVQRGNPEELRVIVAELERSADDLIQIATTGAEARALGEKRVLNPGSTAHDTLLLLGDRRITRYIVAAAPQTAQALFLAMAKSQKYDLPVAQMCMGITAEAVAQRDSFLYHESHGHQSGLLGYLKPVSQAIYGNFALVEGLHGSPLDVPVEAFKWDSEQWTAFGRAFTLTIASYAKTGRQSHSTALASAFHNIKYAYSGLRSKTEQESITDSGAFRNLKSVLHFVDAGVAELDRASYEPPWPIRHRRESPGFDLCEQFASLLYDICLRVSPIKSANWDVWHLQYGVVWSACFGFHRRDSRVWRIIQHKLRRMLYDEILTLSAVPHYQNAPLLGYCLCMVNLRPVTRKGTHRAEAPLAAAIHRWTVCNYGKLRISHPHIAAEVLGGRISFDPEAHAIVKTFDRGLDVEAPKESLPVERPASPPPKGTPVNESPGPGGSAARRSREE